MSEPKIYFSLSDTPFIPAEREIRWIDSSYSMNENAVGSYRWQGVSNGNYQSKHPIFNTNGETIGFISDAGTRLSYTYGCVYAGDCFWITHQTFYAARNNGPSSVSLVEEKGKFLFSSDRKFKVVNSFSFSENWLNTIKAFKLLHHGSQLLYLTEYGFCVFDIYQRGKVAEAEFTDIAYGIRDFTLSPNAKFLAMAVRKEIKRHQNRYDNFIRIYNLETGLKVGDIFLDTERNEHWTVDFSEDGHLLRALLNSSKFVFKLR